MFLLQLTRKNKVLLDFQDFRKSRKKVEEDTAPRTREKTVGISPFVELLDVSESSGSLLVFRLVMHPI